MTLPPEDHRLQPDHAPRRSSWLELQSHASQPAVATVIDEVDLSLPFGVEACLRYTVTDAEGTAIFWFAKRLPGMPVQAEEWIGDARVSRTVMLASSPGGV